MSNVLLEAESRADVGRGASRRLRRLENKVPAVIYGSGKDAENIHLAQNKVIKALENEAIYSSVFTITVDGAKQQVILKDLQRHPYKPVILHMDLQRVSDKDVLIRAVPLHFINEEDAPGIRDGGIISHTMTQVEVRCQAKNLPEFITVDMANLELNGIIHLADLSLPKNVELTVDVSDHAHNHPIVSIHLPKVVVEEEPVVEESTEEAAAEEGEEKDVTEANSSESSEEAKPEENA